MEPVYIKSLRNPLLKEYTRLLESSRYRKRTGKLALEGPNLVREALKAGLPLQAIFFTQDYQDREITELLDDLAPTPKQYVLPRTFFKKIAQTETPQPVAAIFYLLKPECVQKQPLSNLRTVLILDRIQDPGNMGTIIRTAAAAGADVVYYSTGSVDPYSPKVLRATAGTIFQVQLEQTVDPLVLIKQLKSAGLQVIAATAGSGDCYWKADYRQPTTLIIGNEAGGINEDLVKESTLSVEIPLIGAVESINAAVAAAVILYEILRQRMVKMP